MKRPALHSHFCLAMLGTLLATGTACNRRPEPEFERSPEERRQSARVMDSARVAQETQQRSSATSGVTFTDEDRNRFARVEHMIQAKFSGVQVTQGSGGFTIRIRGTGSFVSGNDPLVLIDGVTRTVADIGRINPKEVDRIEIVKDASASFYGVRGANGVILIKTRRGP